MYVKNKKYLIVTASIGSGHNRAAQAIGNEIKNTDPNAEIHIVDFMSTKTAYLNMLLKEAYLAMLNLIPDMYELLYSWTGGRLKGFSVQSMLALAMKNDMKNLIEQYESDVVICTHPFPCAAAAWLKKKGLEKIILAGVITDYAVHQLWVYKEVDLYFVGNAKVKADLVIKGVKEWRIHDTGIPIDPAFNTSYDAALLAEKFGLNLEIPVLLIMGGGLGMGGIRMALDALEEAEGPQQILIVAGENQRLCDELKKCAAQSKNGVHVWGYYDRIPELMAVATLLITKPGALTISEALAMELPMILSEPIPGQEKENAAYLESTGTAVWVKNSRELPRVVEKLVKDRAFLNSMRENARKYKKPQAAKEIVRSMYAFIDPKKEGRVSGM